MDRLPLPRTLVLLLLLVCGSTLCGSALYGQIPTGKEFVVPLPSLLSWAERNDTTIKFVVEVMCSRESKVSIRWANMPASDVTGYLVRDVTVQAGTRVVVMRPMFQLFQIAQSDTRDSSLMPNSRAFLVTSDQPVTVQATFDKNYRAETYMIMPTSSFDTTYKVLTYNGWSAQGRRNGFIVTAREDNTVIRINPRADVLWGRTAGTPYTITLQKYQVYQALTANGGNGTLNDMTGTTIFSNKPVGLTSFGYTSAPRSDNPPPPPPPPPTPPPVRKSESEWTAKTIIEPQLPDSMGGKVFYTAPFARGRTSYARFMTIDTNTIIDVNGTLFAQHKGRGVFFDVPISGPTKIESTGRLIGMQIAVSSDSSGFDTTIVRGGTLPDTTLFIPYGDPMMAYLPPVSQYKSALQWASPNLGERPYKNGTIPLVFYWNHYALITAPITARNSVRIDGDPVNFTMIHNDGRYVSTIIRVLPRQHVVESDEPISVLAYGLTWNDSYGMAAGEALRSVARPGIDSLGFVSCERELDTTFVIYNRGNNSFRIDSVTASGIGIRVLSPPSFPWEVLPGDSAFVSVVFTVNQPGTYQGSIRVHTDANNRQLFTIPVRATRDSAQLQYFSTVDFARLKATETTRDTVISIRNNGSRPVTITGASFDRPGYRIVSPTFPITIGPGASRTITVRFAPTGDGSYESTLRIAGTPCVTQSTITLLGFKGSGATLLVRRSIDYPTYDCATPAPAFVDSTVVFRNTGDEPLQILTAAISGNHAAEFTLLDPVAGVTVLPGESQTIRVRYTPLGYGTRLAQIDITTSASNAATVSIILRAQRDRAAITPSVRTISFGQILSCDGAIDTVLVLQNPGTVSLTLTATSSDQGTFGVDGGAQIILHPGGTAEIPVRFTPAANGDFNATVTVAGTPCGISEQIMLSGRRVSPSLLVSPQTLRFDTLYSCEAGTSRSAQITLTNNGPVADTITGQSIAGSAEFALVGNEVIVLQPGESRTVEVRFTPAGQGSFLGAARFDWGPCAGSSTIDLEATVIDPTVTLSSATLDIGNVDLQATGRGSVTLTNTSPVTRTVNTIDIAPAGSFRLIAPATLPAAIPAGGTLVVEFEYTATTPGAITAGVTLGLAGPCPEQKTVALSATGVGEPIVPVTIGMGVGTLSGFIDETVAIPISIARSTNLALAEGRTLRFWLSFGTRVLSPLGVTTTLPGMTARIVRDSIGGDRRAALIELTGGTLPAEGEIARLEALVLLGDVTTTPLELSLAELIFANTMGRVAQVLPPANGMFTSLGYCETGGSSRMVRRGGMIKLNGGQPNPFGGETEITFELGERREVELRVMDARGVEVALLVDGELDAGTWRIPFMAGELSSGLYVCELRSQGSIHRAMMVLIK